MSKKMTTVSEQLNNGANNVVNGSNVENPVQNPNIVDSDELEDADDDEDEESSNSSDNEELDMSVKAVTKRLIANGNRMLKGIRVRSSIVTKKENYDMVSLSLDKKIPGYISDDDGVFTLGKTSTIFASSFSIGSILKESDETAWAANQLIRNPKGLEVILASSKIDIVQEEVSSGELYVNPFSSNDEGTAMTHDTIINHVVKIEIGNQGKRLLNMLAMRMMMGDNDMMGF